MNIKVIPQWVITTLAIVGTLSIISIICVLFYDFSPTPIPYLSGETMMSDGYAGNGINAPMMELTNTKSITPSREMMYDEGIASQTETKIIKTGSLDLTVDQAQESLREVETLAQSKGGSIQYATLEEHDDGTHTGYVTLRVPADLFDATLNELKNMALIVERESVNTSDVTEQYIDLSARLKNAQSQEARYVEILDKAETVEDILQIESALGNIRGYIESLTGQLQYLSTQTDFSTITVTLTEEPVVTIGGKEFRPGTAVKQALQALVAIVQWLVVALIWVAIVGVSIGAVLALIIWLVWKAFVKNQSPKKR